MVSPKSTIDVSKNLKDIKQWQEFMSIDKTKKYLDNKDIKITNDHLMYDVLVSDTFKHIDNKLKTNGTFNLDLCSETCRQFHKASASQQVTDLRQLVLLLTNVNNLFYSFL